MRQRLRQFRAASGKPRSADFDLARAHLPAPLHLLFASQHPSDIRHAADTARWLLARGHDEPDILQAALLHDVAKGPQRRLDRAVYVLAAHAGVTRRLGAARSRFGMRRAVARSAAHAPAGAALLAQAGASPRVIDLTRRHHSEAAGDAMLALLQEADAAS